MDKQTLDMALSCMKEECIIRMRYLIGSWYSAGGPNIKENEKLFEDWVMKTWIDGVCSVFAGGTFLTYYYDQYYLVTASMWCNPSMEAHAKNYLKEVQAKA